MADAPFPPIPALFHARIDNDVPEVRRLLADPAVDALDALTVFFYIWGGSAVPWDWEELVGRRTDVFDVIRAADTAMQVQQPVEQVLVARCGVALLGVECSAGGSPPDKSPAAVWPWLLAHTKAPLVALVPRPTQRTVGGASAAGGCPLGACAAAASGAGSGTSPPTVPRRQQALAQRQQTQAGP